MPRSGRRGTFKYSWFVVDDVPTRWRTDDAMELYGVDRWGRDYFTVNANGDLAIRPRSTASAYTSVAGIVQELVDQGVATPMLLRFPQLLSDRVRTLYLAFARARKEYDYNGRLRAVFPMKVNQERDVMEEVLRVGKRHNYGLEVGSKAELIAAVALKDNASSLLICNGFKDQEFIEMACLASLFRKNVVVVADKLDEVDLIIRAVKSTGAKPWIGIRARLHSRGGGKWVESGGERAKFGLSVPGILQAVQRFRRAGLLTRVKMLHYHVGSQITDVRRVQLTLREAARIYTSMVKMGVPLRLIDCGGGLGLDYDGSQSTSAMSVNYDLEDYANTLVYTLKSICDDDGVPHPDVVTESGRGVAGYHALLVAEVLGQGTVETDESHFRARKGDPLPLQELADGLQELTAKNYIDVYNDALTHRDDLLDLFNLGQIDLEARARMEMLFLRTCEKVLKHLRREPDPEEWEEEMQAVRRLLARKFLVNFSMFQSAPDAWGVKQLFPVMPIHRLDEEPTATATVCDLTCDSDGELKRYIDVRTTKDVLEVHETNGEPYYLGFMMLGAYQDVLGNVHNLFGPVNEAFIHLRNNGTWEVRKVLKGANARQMLQGMNYDAGDLEERLRQLAEAGLASGVADRQAKGFLRGFRRALRGYTYLRTTPGRGPKA